MTPPISSPEPPHSHLRPDRVSGARHVLTDSAPALHEAATPLVQMLPTAAPRDLAYTRALAAASQRMWAAPDVAALWCAVVDEAVALIAADGAAVVTHTERFWQTLAAHPSDTAPDDSATAAMIEMLFRQVYFSNQSRSTIRLVQRLPGLVLVTVLTIGYLISRGLAKSGSRDDTR
jgi:hypothetical protein